MKQSPRIALAIVGAAALAIIAAALISSGASAQRPGPGQMPNPNAGDGPGAERFWPAAPEVGELFPDVEVVDNAGRPVNIRNLPTENYAVIVLGCLT